MALRPALRPRGAPVGPDDPRRDQPARRGPRAPGRRADRRRPAPVQGLLRQLRPGAVLPRRRRSTRSSARRCSPGGSCGWRWTPSSACWPTRSRGATRRSRWRSPAWLAVVGGDGVPDAPAPQRSGTRARVRGAPPRAPVARGRGGAGGRGLRLPLRPRRCRGDRGGHRAAAALAGRAAAVGRLRPSRRLRASPPRRSPRPSSLLPSSSPRPATSGTRPFGFALDEQSLQRLPLPGSYDGAFEPNKLLALYLPYVLIAGLALWLVVAAATRAPLRLWAPFPLAWPGSPTCSPGRTSSTWSRWPPCCRSCSPRAPARAARRPQPRGARSRHSARARRPPRPRPEADRDPHAPAARAARHRRRRRRQGARRRGARARELVRTSASSVPAGAPIFVANPRHDLVRAGNPLVYVLVDRPTRPATTSCSRES